MTDDTKANLAAGFGLLILIGIAIAVCVTNFDRIYTAVSAALN
jgi:hypothetical protein